MTLAIRSALPADRKFIIASWLDSTKDDNMAGLVPCDEFTRTMWPSYEAALDRPGVQALVAYETSASSPDFDAYGWVVFDASPHAERPGPISATWPALLYYIYVKSSYRRSGIARKLMHGAGIDPASRFAYAWTNALVSDIKDKIPAAKWRPLLARRKKIAPHQPTVTTKRAG